MNQLGQSSSQAQAGKPSCLLCDSSIQMESKKLTNHMIGEHDVFFNQELIIAINTLDKDTLEEIVSEFEKSYAMIMETEAVTDNTVDCLLCNGRINFVKDGKQKFANHFKGEHDIFFNHNLMMAINFLDKNTQDDIVSRSKTAFDANDVPVDSNSDIEMLLRDSEDEDNPEELSTLTNSISLSQTNDPKINSFKCKQCEKSFLYNSTLIKHMLTHTEKSQFNCEVCRKSFVNSNYLNHHMGTVHRNTVTKSVDRIKPIQSTQKAVSTNQKSFDLTESKDVPKKEDVVATTCPVCNRFYSTIELFAKHIFSGVHGLDITLSDEMKSKLEKVFETQNLSNGDAEDENEDESSLSTHKPRKMQPYKRKRASNPQNPSKSQAVAKPHTPQVLQPKSQMISKPIHIKQILKPQQKMPRTNLTPKTKRKSETEIPDIVQQPYIKKRIKQNLKDINFDEDSDENEEWKEKEINKKTKNKKSSDENSVMNLDESFTKKVLPKRGASRLQSLKEVDSDGE